MDQLVGDLRALVASEDEPRAIWSDPVRRIGLLLRLDSVGEIREAFREAFVDIQVHLFR